MRMALEIGAVCLAPHHHLVGQHLAKRRDEGRGGVLLLERHRQPAGLEQAEHVAGGGVRKLTLVGNDVMLGAVTRGDVVLGDERHQIGRALDPVNFLGLALGHQRAEREFRGKSGFDVQGRILCVPSCRKTNILSLHGLGSQCERWGCACRVLTIRALKMPTKRLCPACWVAEPWNRQHPAGHELRRCVPHGSLPPCGPCGGGTGEGGGDKAPSAKLVLCRLHAKSTGDCSLSGSDWKQMRSACCTPLPVPPPQGGRERCGTTLHKFGTVFASEDVS